MKQIFPTYIFRYAERLPPLFIHSKLCQYDKTYQLLRTGISLIHYNWKKKRLLQKLLLQTQNQKYCYR